MAEYDALILRIWRSMGIAGPQWCARLEHVQRAGITQFNSPEALLEHLRQIISPLMTPVQDSGPADLAGNCEGADSIRGGEGRWEDDDARTH